MRYRLIPFDGAAYRGLALLAAGLIGLGLWSAWQMEHQGHIITGMSNQVVWGLPHVFAIFLIIASSGALNIASIGSVFGQDAYKPWARLSGLMAIGLLVGGLCVLVLDLGRPDRLIVAMTHYNFRSIFAWNIFLYTGFLAVVAIYLWTLMDPPLHARTHQAGMAAFIWRLVLTTGTGSIFGFLVAREAYDTAILAPLFIAQSLVAGLALFLLFTLLASRGRPDESAGLLDKSLLRRMNRLLAMFVGASAYLIVTMHLTNLYAAEHLAYEHYILLGHPQYRLVFWVGTVLLGTVVPLYLCLRNGREPTTRRTALAAAAALAGTFSWLYTTIIAGQAYPLDMFPGYQIVDSGFLDGVVETYAPTWFELGLGLGGVGVAAAIVIVGLRVLPFMPER